MSVSSEQVFQTEALLLEILSFLDVASLGRAEQTAVAFREASPGAWKVHADKIHGHHCSSKHSMNHNPAADGDSDGVGQDDFKEQVRRYFRTRNYTRTVASEHQRHFLQGSVYPLPRREPELPPNCSQCSAYPNLKTSVLLASKYEQQQQQYYAFFVRMSVVDRHGDEQPNTAASTNVILEEFVRIHEVKLSTASPNDTRNGGRYVTLRLNLSDTFQPDRYPSLAYFLKGCRELQATAAAAAARGGEDARNIRQPHVWFPSYSKLLLEKLEVAVTAVDLTTGTPSLLLATGGGMASSPTDFFHWTMPRRKADSHPTPTAIGFGVVPTVGASISLLSDYTNLEALEISIS